MKFLTANCLIPSIVDLFNINAFHFRNDNPSGNKRGADDLSHVVEAFTLQERYLSDNTSALLELHKASEVTVSEDDFILDTIGSWSGSLLKEQLRSSDVQTTPLLREVLPLV